MKRYFEFKILKEISCFLASYKALKIADLVNLECLMRDILRSFDAAHKVFPMEFDSNNLIG